MQTVPFGIQLYVLAMYEVEFVEKELKSLKLDKHQFLYIIIASIYPGIVQSVIAQYFNVNKSTSGRMIAKLIDRGYLRREKTENHRDFHIFLTELGESLKNRIFESVSRYENILLEQVDDKEALKQNVFVAFSSAATSRKGGKK